ncbi:MAG: hypothetical protein R3D57_07770 [Hyphomicrobiaceae bacterium]
MLFIVGAFVSLGFFGGMLWRTAFRWRVLAEAYPALSHAPIEERSWQSAVLIGRGGFNALKGIVKIGVHETGVSMRILLPFSLFHPPLFIPYGDIRGWRTTWYLDARSSELELRRAPDIKMVMPAEQVEWISGFSGNRMTLHRDRPPNGNAGRGWHALVVASIGLSVVMIGLIAVQLATR